MTKTKSAKKNLINTVCLITTDNVAGTYSGFKNLEITGGIKNLFAEEPAASNVLDNFQNGYDPRYSDPTGRTFYVRGTYKF